MSSFRRKVCNQSAEDILLRDAMHLAVITYTLKRDYIPILRIGKKDSPKTVFFGGDGGRRTHVRKSIPETFYERSLSFKIPSDQRR